MARAPRQPEETLPISEPVTETLIYVPGEGDPPIVQWGGHKFHANVPKEITGNADGSERDRLNLHIIERARDNKHFRVSGQKPKRDPAALPKTAEEYRAYMITWLKDPAIQHADDLIARFTKDRELQSMCEVGADDYAYLGTLFMPRLHELARADELKTEQVAQLWLQHGVNQLPW